MRKLHAILIVILFFFTISCSEEPEKKLTPPATAPKAEQTKAKPTPAEKPKQTQAKKEAQTGLPTKLAINKKNSKIENSRLKIAGWAVSSQKINKVLVYMDNKLLGEAKYGLSRPGVLKKFPEYNEANSGYKFEKELPKPIPAKIEIRVEAVSNDKVMGKKKIIIETT